MPYIFIGMGMYIYMSKLRTILKIIHFIIGKLYILNFYVFLLLYNYSCPHFSPLLSPALPTPTSHIQSSSPSPLSSSMGPLCMFPDDPSPYLPHYPPPHSTLFTVSLFFISMSLGIFCLLVCFVD